MCKVSVIVPIYHGKKYIEPMIRQIEACWKYADGKINIELLLVNDSPDVPLSKHYSSKYIDIVILNTKINRGVQSARVRGLGHCNGDYILFLDQDDKIVPEYLKKQLEKIKGHDAAVCKAIHEKKPFYNHTRPFPESISMEYMLRKGDSIISPGQVLLRKESISEIWKKNILRNNGADDWLLWLSMMAEGKSFAFNDEILFEHIVESNNASFRILEMQHSEWEVLEILKNSHVLSEENINRLTETIQTITETRLQLLGKFQRISCIYDTWMSLKNRNVHISEYLRQKGYRKIAIYGVTGLGKQLDQELSADDYEVSYFIDINAPFFNERIAVYSPEESLPQVDAVMISLVQNERQISELLKKKLEADIFTFAELLDKVEGLPDA